MKKNLLSLLLMSLVTLSVFAQSRKITGTVTGADDGQSIPGVSVKVQGTTVGTQTNAQGQFSLTVPATAKTLSFSFIGYTEQTVSIGTKTVINVKLATNSKALGEVVVVGYGTGVKTADAVGDITTVSAQVISDKPVANAFDALQGQVAGLSVFTSSGEPSATPSLALNGISSLTSSVTPLIVLDGVPVALGSILSLNPDDFESVTVLKDAASTSIYGSRAANGVLFITSKKGVINKPTISFTSTYGVNRIANPEYFQNFFDTPGFAAFEVASGAQTQAQINTTLATYNANTQWYKVYFKPTTSTWNDNLSVSGGSGKTTYFVSAGYFKQDGLMYRSTYDRYTFRSNVASEVTDWMKFGVNLSLGYDERQTNPYGSNQLNGGLAILDQPWYSPTDANGNNYDFIPGLGRYHPNYLANELPDYQNNAQFDPTAFLQITPIKGLTLKTQAGMDDFDFRESTLQLPSYLGSLNNGSDTETFQRGLSKTFTNTAEYKFSVNNANHFTALIGQEYTDGSTNTFAGVTKGQTDDRLLTLSTGTTNKTATSSYYEYDYQSLFARADYDYNSKYFLESSIRQDKSSKFGANTNAAIFYSVGGSWKAKQESFLKDLSWLTDLTVRASTGTTGNSSFGTGTAYYQQLASVGTNAYNTGTGYVLTQPGDANLTWETVQNTQVGFSTTLFNKLNIDFSYYVKNTKNMLLSVPFVGTSGFTSQIQNVGTMQNKGIDLDVNYTVWSNNAHRAYITPHFVVNVNGNKITSLFNNLNYYITPNTGLLWAVGQPVRYIEPIWAGVNPANGLPQWYNPDPNPNNIVNKTTNQGVTTAFSPNLQQDLNLDRYAPYTGGFGVTAGYEGFSLDANFSFVSGKYITNNDAYFTQNPGQFSGFNQDPAVLNYWKQPGDVTQFPALGQQFTQFDSRLIQDASFIRLKNLTIGYSIPKSLLEQTKVLKGLKIYFTGRDLLTFTKYKGIDPEVDSNIGLGNNPNTKEYTFGVNATF